jgi:hypothetical protein
MIKLISLQATDLNIALEIAKAETARFKEEIASHKGGVQFLELQVAAIVVAVSSITANSCITRPPSCSATRSWLWSERNSVACKHSLPRC